MANQDKADEGSANKGLESVIEPATEPVTENPIINRYVKSVDGKITVDWHFIDLPKAKYEIARYLWESDVLSSHIYGNYGLIGPNGSMNPRVGDTNLYFTRREDAEAYREAYVQNPHYRMYLVKFER